MEAKSPLRFRRLRIAWSVAWSTAAVLIIALWVRSYWRFDAFHFTVGSRMVGSSSVHGCTTLDSDTGGAYPAGYYSCLAKSVTLGELPEPFLWFHFNRIPTGWTFTFSMWFPVATSIVVAAMSWVPWFPTRFTLRALL